MSVFQPGSIDQPPVTCYRKCGSDTVMALDDVKISLANKPALFLALMLLLLLGACSGATSGGAGATGKPKQPCATPDQGVADKSAASYYQIGTCPVDESEGEEVNQDE